MGKLTDKQVVNGLEFRLGEGRIKPHEVFYATAEMYFKKSIYDKSLALAKALNTGIP